MEYIIYVPFVLLIFGVILIFATGLKLLGRIISTLALCMIAVTAWILTVFMIALTMTYQTIYIASATAFITATLALFVCLVWGALGKKAAYIPIVSVLLLSLIAAGSTYGYKRYVDSVQTVEIKNNDILVSYAPYYELTKVAELDGEPSLKLGAADGVPRMDGATALYPVYSAFAKAVYPKSMIDEIARYDSGDVTYGSSEVLTCTTTAEAYEKIATGEADIIFVAGPSEEQEEFAKEQGVELIYTPIGKEAFVFFVNFENPIADLTLDEIKDIYSGKTKRWSDLGVSGFGKIRAFQRDEGSGSQTALIKLMDGEPLAVPPKEEVIAGMGGIIEKTADYKNYKNAIGYSFRFYTTEMVNNDNIKLLKINGVYPSEENIANGSYPVSSYFYAVTRSDASESTKKLLSWLCGPEAKELIKKTGYTPID